MTTTATANTGTVAQIFGAVVDVRFPPGKLPAIYNSIHIEGKEKGSTLVPEVA